MAQLIKSIVDPNGKLVGFLVEGKDSEFGGILQDKVQKAISINEMIKQRFYNRQVAVDPKTNRLVARGKFQISDLPMAVLTPNGLVDVGNGIELTGRFLKDGVIVGFTVKFDSGAEKKLVYKDVLAISRWYNPKNFVVRRGANGNEFIAGKANVLKLEELPATEINPAAKPVKRTKPTKVEKAEGIDSALIPEKSIMDVFDYIGNLNGIIIKLPDEAYKSTSTASKQLSAEFMPLGIGEVAVPKLTFGNSKLSANANFKKLGRVQVDYQNQKVPVDCYTISTKSVFFNGEAYIKRLGVALPADKVQSFINAFGDTLGITEMTQDYVTQPIKAIQGDRSLKFYEVDISKLSIISKARVEKSILSAEQIREIVIASFAPRLICKYLSNKTGLIAELKKEIPKNLLPSEGVPAPYLRHLQPDFLQAIEDTGVDITSGMFKRTVGIPKDKDASGTDDIAITIEYNVSGYSVSKITYKNIKEWVDSDPGKLPKEVVAIADELKAIGSPVERLERANALFKEYSEIVERFNYTLWLHRCAMYIKSNKTGIHSHDKDCWVIDPKKRSKAKIYKCTKPGCQDLAIALINIDII